MIMTTRIGNLTMTYNKYVFLHAKDCWEEMKIGWETEKWFIPELTRKYKRKFYHGVGESGNEVSGYSSVPFDKISSKKDWMSTHDLEQEHPYAPEMVGLHMYYCGEYYFSNTDQFHENFLPMFVLCRRTILVPGELNSKLKESSGRFENHSNVIKKVPSCLTRDKYTDVGINVLYDIDCNNEEVKIEDAIPVPDVFTNWQIQQHEEWNNQLNPLKQWMC